MLGQVPGEVIAAAFAVFNPAAVVPAVQLGWTRTDAATICEARTGGAIGQLRRVLGDAPDGLARATELLDVATSRLRPEGRPLFAGLLALGLPDDPIGAMWRLGDQLREYRGDVHTAAWTSAGFDATEIGLLSELYWGLPMRSYVRTRAWTGDDLDGAVARLESRGLVADGGFTAEGRAAREAVEQATDRQCRPIIEAIGDDLDELIGILEGWSRQVRIAKGYPGTGPHDLAELAEPRRAPEVTRERGGHGMTRILQCCSGSPRAANAPATPSSPTSPVMIGVTSISPSAIERSEAPNSIGS